MSDGDLREVELIAERAALINQKWSGRALSSRQRRRLAVIHKCLDRIEMRDMAPNFKRMEREIRHYQRECRRAAADLTRNEDA